MGIYLEIMDILNCAVLTDEELGRVIRYVIENELGHTPDLSKEPKHIKIAFEFLEGRNETEKEH